MFIFSHPVESVCPPKANKVQRRAIWRFGVGPCPCTSHRAENPTDLSKCLLEDRTKKGMNEGDEESRGGNKERKNTGREEGKCA